MIHCRYFDIFIVEGLLVKLAIDGSHMNAWICLLLALSSCLEQQLVF